MTAEEYECDIEAQGIEIENLNKRIAELNKVLQSMIEELEVDLDYRGMNIKSYCPLCCEVSYGEFSSVQELRHQDTCPWVIAKKLISEGGGVCQNCMGEGVDLIQSGRMVIREICTSCNGTGKSEGGADE